MSTNNHQKNQPRWKVGATNPQKKYANKNFTQRGGYWYETPKKPAAAAPPATPAPAPAPAPVLPPAPTGPPQAPDKLYGKNVPQVYQDQLNNIQWEQQNAQNNMRDTQGWLGNALTQLAGYSTQAQDTYLSQLNAASGSASAAAAGQEQRQYGAYGAQANAAGQLAQGTQSTALQMQQHQSAMAKMMPAEQGQAHLAALAQTAAGIPAQYQARYREAMESLDQMMHARFIDDRNYKADHKRWGVAERKDNQRYNDSLLMQQQEALSGLLGGSEHFAPPDLNSLPDGKTIVPKDDGGWSIINDPGYSSSSGATNGAKDPYGGKVYSPNELGKQGYVGGWAKKPAGLAATQAANGKWYAKKSDITRMQANQGNQKAQQNEALADIDELFTAAVGEDGNPTGLKQYQDLGLSIAEAAQAIAEETGAPVEWVRAEIAKRKVQDAANPFKGL